MEWNRMEWNGMEMDLPNEWISDIERALRDAGRLVFQAVFMV